MHDLPNEVFVTHTRKWYCTDSQASLEESEADADLKNASMKRCRKSEDGVNVIVKCVCRIRAGSCRNKCLDQDTLRRVDTSLKGCALLDRVR